MSECAPLADVLVAIEAAGCVPAALVPSVIAHLHAFNDAQGRRLGALQQANAERRDAIRAAIRAAADEAITATWRRLYKRRQWAGMLHSWLGFRYQRFGLDCVPCKRTIRAALIDWTPPNGCIADRVSNECIEANKLGRW